MHRAVVLILLPLILTGQNGSSNFPADGSTTQTPPQDLCRLEGQVFNAASGELIRKANILLRRVDSNPRSGPFVPATYTTSTDFSGKFAMKDVEPGKYRLTATHSGFVASEYGARGPGRQGTTIALDRAQSMTDLTLRMTPHGVITGRIVDQDGDPAADVQVQLGRFRYTQGRKQFTNSDVGFTNDLGEYRIFGVAPGKYYMTAALPRNAANAGVDRSATPPSNEDYVPTYYPGTFDIGAAVQLEATPGADLRNVNLTLRKAHTVNLSGRVVSAMAPGPPLMVALTSRTGAPGLGFMRSAQAGSDGKFVLRGVPSGSYFLNTSTNQNGRVHTSRQVLEVGDSDIDNLNLSVGPGLEIHGRVRVENDAPLNLPGVRIALQPRELGVIVFAQSPSVSLTGDGGFMLESISPDSYNVVVTGLPAGFYVKAVRVGQTDVLVSGMDLTNGGPGDVDVVLSPNVAQVDGMVQSPKNQQLAPGATVVLIPDEPERRDQQRDFRTATTDQTGHFTLKTVVPGKYTVYAWEDVEAGAYFDPDFLKSFEDRGAKVEVPEGGQLGLQLTLIPADSGP